MKSSNVFLFLICLVTSQVVLSKTEELNLISNINMFDVGLAKINDDKYYDIYTINQQYAESILIAKNGKFVESGLSMGLKQTYDLPDYEPTGRSPEIKKGLNIYTSTRRQLIVYCHECDNNIKGSIIVPTPNRVKDSIKVIHEEGATHNQKYKIKVGQPSIFLDFEMEKTGLLVLDVTYLDLNISFEVDYSAEKIFVGENSVSPSENKFSINSRDNHSFAWAKINDDNHTDVFMTSGGLRASIKNFHPRAVIPGLLYVKNPETKLFEDKFKDSRIFKDVCITYRSEWVDVDNDGDLDLFLGCRNGLNQMNRQYGFGKGKFENITIDYNFGFHHGEEFAWIDWNNDKVTDLLLIQNNNFYIYKNKISKVNTPLIKKVQTFPNLGKKLNSINSSIRTFDIDNTGTPEVFVSTRNTIHIFKQDDKNVYQKIDITDLNLPKDISGKINFVDVNLDGLIDICVYNRGIFLQDKDNKFKESKLFPELFNKRNTRYKNLIWFDADINGQWDVLNAESFKPKTDKQKSVKLMSYTYNDYQKWDHLNLHRNISKTKNNWLQIDLEGFGNNRDAIGAKVILTTKDGVTQTRFNHGSSDSLHSQGHYRHYFGLNKHKIAEIEVIWPDGKVTNLKDIKANQLFVIKYDETKAL